MCKSEKAKLNFIKDKLTTQINSFDRKREDNKKKSFFLHMMVTVLSALTTIVLGLKIEVIPYQEHYAQNIALVLAGVITVMGAYNSFFNHKKLWVNFTQIRNNLYELKLDIDYYEQGNDSLEMNKIDDFKNRFQQIMDESNQQWSELRDEE